jgi:hypothetical protein
MIRFQWGVIRTLGLAALVGVLFAPSGLLFQ